MSDTHVVFGAAGALGSAIVRKLVERGEAVRAIVRDPEYARELLPDRVAIVPGTAEDLESAVSGCRGAAVVYHCANVRYSEWTSSLPRATENILEGAREAGARLLFPGNVYSYGKFQTDPATEEHPTAATSKKGILRRQLEETLMGAHEAGDVRVVIPRYPDFYGINVINPIFAPIFESALAGKSAAWPGKLDVPHSLIFVEDAAEAAILLGGAEDAFGQMWHVPGPEPLTGRQFIELIFREAGNPPRTRSLSGIMFRLFGIFVPDAGEMVELLYQFEQPMVLDGRKFARAFPHFQYTPHQEAVRRTLEWFRQRAGR